MAITDTDLRELLDATRGGGDADVVRRGVEYILQALIDAEAIARIGALRAGRDPHDAAHPMLPPSEAHGGAVDGQVDVVDHRAFFHLGPLPAPGTRDDAHDLLDHQLHVGVTPLVVELADVLQTHQGLDDLARVGANEGASCFLAHTSSLRHLRCVRTDLLGPQLPLRSEEPEIRRAR